MGVYPVLRISLLNEFKVVEGYKPFTTINTPRLRALFSYLLLHRDAPQPRQHVAFLFWPDSSEAQAQTNLRNLLLVLRRAFPDAERYISIERRSLQWRNDSLFALDVTEFQQSLARAEHALIVAKQDSDGPHDPASAPPTKSSAKLQETIDIYAGDLLPACYDEWVLAPREQLRQGFLWALTALVSALEDEGELNTAALYAQRLLRHDPLQEENYRRLMRLHLAMADRAGVINVYRQCERMLRRELGVETSDATRRLLHRSEELMGHESVEGLGTRPRARGKGRAYVAGNLPTQTAAFIGREREVAEISKQLRQPGSRLVTLTGTPGTGKTRLAIQVASGMGDFADGVFFVSLAPLTEPKMVEHSIAQALEVTESANRPLRDSLVEALRDKHTLLVLDNFEHLLPAATLVAELLASCPQLKVLATSRAPLNLRGEHEHAVPPMSVPGRDAPPEPDDLVQYEAVALFVERALEVYPHFALTRENARLVAEICRKLEGLPLAIELAAARIKALTPEIILSRLDRRLKLLVGGKSDLPPRQQALETAIAWSYNLLDHNEKAIFRGLSVFAGGWSLQAAEEVLRQEEPGTGSILESMISLLNKSLLVRTEAQGTENELRFEMLETIREYARERLQESGEREALEREHAFYYMSLAEEAEPHLIGTKQVEWLSRLEKEHDNFRAALRWAREERAGEAAKEASEIGLRIVGAMWQLWQVRSYQTEGKEQLTQALAVARSLPALHQTSTESQEQQTDLGRSKSWQGYMAKALYAAGRTAFQEDDYPSAHSLFEQSLAIQQEVTDKRGIVYSLNSLGVVAQTVGDYVTARSLYEKALAICRTIDEKSQFTYSLQGLGRLALLRGDYSAALVLLEESLVIARQEGDKRGIAWSLYLLGLMAQLQENNTAARTLFEESLLVVREIGYRVGIAQTLGNLGSVACSHGDYSTASALYRESLLIRQEASDRYGIAICLIGLGGIAIRRAIRPEHSEGTREQEEGGKGVMLLGAGEALMETIGAQLVWDEGRVYERGVATAREMLDEAAFARAWAEGRAMSMEQAITLALALT